MLPVCGRKSGRIILRLHFINERAKSIFLLQVEEDQAAAAVSISFKQHFPFFFLKRGGGSEWDVDFIKYHPGKRKSIH